MKLFHATSHVKFAAATLAILASPAGFANDLANNVVNLEVGNWENKQSVTINGHEISHGALGGTECLTEAESQLTIGEYLEKFVQNVGSDHMCTFSDFRGAGGNVTIDVSCSIPDGTTTAMTLNYKYSRTNVSVLGEGMVTTSGTSVPIKVVGTSQYLGACS